MLLLLTVHCPLLLVVQEAVPLTPLLQLPATVALATGLWLASCTTIVTVAVQSPVCWVPVPSKSPTCKGTGMGVKVRVGVCVRVAVGPGVFVLIAVIVKMGVGVRVGVEPGGFVGVAGGGVDAPSAGPI